MVFEIRDYDSFKLAVEDFCRFLASHGIPEEKIFDSKLVLHELLGNVLQHSGGGASLQAEIVEEFIRIAVRAENVFRPPTEGRCADLFAERGRGLFLVDKVSERTYTKEGEILVHIQIK